MKRDTKYLRAQTKCTNWWKYQLKERNVICCKMLSKNQLALFSLDTTGISWLHVLYWHRLPSFHCRDGGWDWQSWSLGGWTGRTSDCSCPPHTGPTHGCCKQASQKSISVVLEYVCYIIKIMLINSLFTARCTAKILVVSTYFVNQMLG